MRGRGWAVICCASASLALASGCGGATSKHGAGAEPTTDTAPTASELRFSKLAAGVERYCGLTTKGDVVCVKQGQVELTWQGPFIDIAFHQDLLEFSELCAIREGGQLECETAPELVPQGQFKKVAVGFFNPCALDLAGRVVCWFDDVLGGSPAPEIEGAVELSVDMDYGCVAYDAVSGHFRCFGLGPAETAYADVHLFRFAVAPKRTCGMSLGPSTTGLVCVDETGVTQMLPGAFNSLDVDVNGDGCAVNAEGVVQCWDGLTDLAPTGTFSQVSVAPGRVCTLDADGAARCFPD